MNGLADVDEFQSPLQGMQLLWHRDRDFVNFFLSHLGIIHKDGYRVERGSYYIRWE